MYTPVIRREAAFPVVWQRVDDLVVDGRFFIPEEVWEEVCAKDAVAKAWCEPRKEAIVVPTDAATVAEVQAILAAHERLVMNMKGPKPG